MISQIHHKWRYLYNVCKTFLNSVWEAFPGKSCCWQMDSQYQDQTGYSTCFEVTLCRHSDYFVCLGVSLMCSGETLTSSLLSHTAFTNQRIVCDAGLQECYVSMQAASGLIQLKSNCPCIVLTLCMREFKSLLSFSSVGLEPVLETS